MRSHNSSEVTTHRAATACAGRIWAALLIMGLLACGYSLLHGDAGRLWRALLIQFIYFVPLSAGLVVWSAVVLVSRGRWAASIEHLALGGVSFSLPSAAALIALWCGAASSGLWRVPSDPAVSHWLRADFRFGRDLAALAIFWWLAWCHLRARRRGGGASTGGVLIVVYGLVFSLLGFDLVMALDPLWNSALFGGYFFISGLYAAVAAWALMAAAQRTPDPDCLHDLGRLVVVFSLLTAYMMYSQLLPIWFENLPAEVRFVMPRWSAAGWKAAGAAVLGVVYFGPLILLLPVRAKRSPRWLGTVATLVLIGLWMERWWLVAPTFDPRPSLGIEDGAMAAVFAGALGVCFQAFRRRALPLSEGAPRA